MSSSKKRHPPRRGKRRPREFEMARHEPKVVIILHSAVCHFELRDIKGPSGGVSRRPRPYPLPFHRSQQFRGVRPQYVGVFAKFQHIHLPFTRLNFAHKRVRTVQSLCQLALRQAASLATGQRTHQRTGSNLTQGWPPISQPWSPPENFRRGSVQSGVHRTSLSSELLTQVPSYAVWSHGHEAFRSEAGRRITSWRANSRISIGEYSNCSSISSVCSPSRAHSRLGLGGV